VTVVIAHDFFACCPTVLKNSTSRQTFPPRETVPGRPK
jgi:hypothetical protein